MAITKIHFATFGGFIRRNPPRPIARQQLGRRASFEIEMNRALSVEEQNGNLGKSGTPDDCIASDPLRPVTAV